MSLRWMMASVYISNVKSKNVLLIMGNFATHSLKHVGKGESFSLSTLQLTNICIAFIPPNFTKCGPTLGLGDNCFIQVWYKKKLLEWVLP